MPKSWKGKEKVCNRESTKKKTDGNKDVDPQLWHAFAGGMVQIPKVNSKIFYFPQGHAEHGYEPVDFTVADFKIPSRIQCSVAAIHYRADPDTDEVYAKLRLVPLKTGEVIFDDHAVGGIDNRFETKYKSHTKTLPQSDISKGNGFFCTKKCAEAIFPPLDYSGTRTSQFIYPTDVHGETWELKHVYSGTLKRHMLFTGSSDFLTEKLLVAGDSLVFVRAENGDLHIGIRRSKRRNNFGFNPSSNSKNGNESGIHLAPPDEELKSSSGEKDNKPPKTDEGNELRISDKVMGIGKVKAEDVIKAVKLGFNMQPFDVVYYPGDGTPEFFVETTLVRTALETRWNPGMRFKMAIVSEDSSRISRFIGTIASVQPADSAWPDSVWRLLQVTWDRPDLVTNMKRVNPWQVEILPYKPPLIPSSPFLPSSKEVRLPQPVNNDATSSNTVPNNPPLQEANTRKDVSCSRSISTQPSEKQDQVKPEKFRLLGQTILVDSKNEKSEKKIT